MDSSRRGFLSVLGIGSVAVPIGATGLFERGVRLVEPAKVEVIEKLPSEPDLLDLMRDHRQGEIQVLMKTAGGHVHRLAAKTFFTECNVRPVEVTSYMGSFREFVPGPSRMEWTFSGICTESWLESRKP
jgi:hypothetical protein